MNVYQKIKKLCADNKTSIKQLEKAAGLSNGSIGKWDDEKEKFSLPTTDALSKVANYFNVSVDWLLGLTDEPNKKKPTPKEVDLETFEAALREKGLTPADFEKLSKEQWAVIADIIKNFKQ